MEKLEIYQEALGLVVKIYTLIRKNKNLASDYSLCDQLKRAAVSIVANIAEGYLRSRKHFRNYLQIASGSANEIVALLQVAFKVHGVDTNSLQQSYKILGRRINAFSRRLN